MPFRNARRSSAVSAASAASSGWLRRPSQARTCLEVECVIFELSDELARRGQREAELAGDLADRPLAFGGDVRQHTDMAAAERRVAADELEQLGCRASARPRAPHDAAQELPELAQVVTAGNIRHVIKVIAR